MEVTYLFTAKRPNSNEWFDLNFPTEDGSYSVTENWDIRRTGELRPGEKPRMITLGPRSGRTAFQFTYDDTPHSDQMRAAKGELATARDTKMKRVIDLIKADKRVFVKGEDEAEEASMNFYLENPTISDSKRLDVSDKKYEAYGILRKYSDEQLVDLAYFFGVNPTNKSNVELRALLTDYDMGVALNYATSPTSPKSNLDKFLTEYAKGNPTALMQREIQKAVSVGVIEMKGTGYYYGGSLIGTSETQAIGYFMGNAREYTVLQDASSKKVPVPKQAGHRKGKSSNPANESPTDEALRLEGKALGIASAHNKDIDKLKVEIEEAKGIRLLAREHGVNTDERRSISKILEDLEDKNIQVAPILPDKIRQALEEEKRTSAMA